MPPRDTELDHVHAERLDLLQFLVVPTDVGDRRIADDADEVLKTAGTGQRRLRTLAGKGTRCQQEANDR